MVLGKIYRTCQNYGLDPDIMLCIRMWFRSPGRYGRLMTFVLWDDLCWSLISLLRSPYHWDRGIHAAPDGGGYGGYLVEKQRETKKRPKNDTSCERSIRWHIQNAFTIFCTKSFKVSFKRNILTEENGKHGKQLYNLLSQSSQWKYGFRFWNEPFPLAQIARQSIVSLSIIQQWWVFMHDTMILFMLVVLVLRWNTDWRPFATLLSSQGRFSWSPGLWNTRDRHGGRRQLKLAGPRANTGEATSTDEVEENNSWMMITSSHSINEI